MSTETNPTPPVASTPETAEETQSFSELLAQYAQPQSTVSNSGQRQIDAVVAAITADSVLLDIGFKTEGSLPLTAFSSAPAVGDHLSVSVQGRGEDGYYRCSLLRVVQATDLTSLEEAFKSGAIVSGTVTAAIKGGFSVDLGVRAFMPSSRSGTRDAAEAAALVGQPVAVRITKFEKPEDEDSEEAPDLVVDRRSVLEEQARAQQQARLAELAEGATVAGTVRSLTSYGAFVDLGGTDALLHVSDIAWTRVSDPASVLAVGQALEVRILKIDSASGKISVGLRQLQPHPWESVPQRYHVGDRVRGTVTREADFGAFVELEPGVEGLIHISEMSWTKKVRKPSDLLKVGDTVETVVLSIDPAAHRLGLGLKQTLGDPWVEAAQRISAGSTVEGPIVSFTRFGAFLQMAEGVEGMIHISEITPEKRLNHPSEALRLGERVQALVLEMDATRRQARLSIKQLIPTDLDEFFTAHQVGETVTGRVLQVSAESASVELGQGVVAQAALPTATAEEAPAAASSGPVDLSALGSLLKAKWQGAAPTATAKPRVEPAAPGQIRTFRITSLDAASRTIKLQLL
ncbi:MAG: S1 RNA-binding domain-containing protein [Acidobacteriota bacterium]|nr:S1 RNA-binding domain-containing protein [Acidobacteriota bacterium]